MPEKRKNIRRRVNLGLPKKEDEKISYNNNNKDNNKTFVNRNRYKHTKSKFKK